MHLCSSNALRLIQKETGRCNAAHVKPMENSTLHRPTTELAVLNARLVACSFQAFIGHLYSKPHYLDLFKHPTSDLSSSLDRTLGFPNMRLKGGYLVTSNAISRSQEWDKGH
jgi:hypothetical protein